jgi:hypothetical protein
MSTLSNNNTNQARFSATLPTGMRGPEFNLEVILNGKKCFSFGLLPCQSGLFRLKNISDYEILATSLPGSQSTADDSKMSSLNMGSPTQLSWRDGSRYSWSPLPAEQSIIFAEEDQSKFDTLEKVSLGAFITPTPSKNALYEILETS